MNIGTKSKTLFKGFFEDTRAVSPIVATLVLVVVAISGAAAVGTIMGTFSSDVSGQANTGELAAASSTEILIAGSTTVQPVSELIAEAYMDDHQGIRVTVQGGGSSAGISSVGMGIVDIGAASKPVDPTDPDYISRGYDLNVYQIGGSAVIVIGGTGYNGVIPTETELKALYDNVDSGAACTLGGAALLANTEIVQRADASGTEETFAKFVTGNKNVDDAAIETVDATTIVAETGNAGVLAKVQSTANSIGFVDYGFAIENGLANVDILAVTDDAAFTSSGVAKGISGSTLKSDIKDELKNDDGTNYHKELTRPLNYITNGEPTSMEQAYITFAMSPGSTTYFEECGYFAITEFA